MKRIFCILRYVVLFLCNFALLMLFHSYLNFILFAALCLLPVCSFFMLRQISGHLTASLTLPHGPMSKNDPLFLVITLHNSSFLPLPTVSVQMQFENLFYQTSGTHQLILPARAKQDTSVTYPLQSERCGALQVSISSICLHDILGFFERSIPCSEQQICVLFPPDSSTTDCMEPLLREDQLDDKTIRSFVESSEVTGIREYRPGDKLQNIHWKLSAKEDSLLVKEKNGTATKQFRFVSMRIPVSVLC